MGVMERGKNNFSQSLFENQRSYNFYFYKLLELSISMFEWVNLPESVDARFIETCLFDNGCAVWFYDDVMGNLCLRCAIGAPLNVYDIPTNRRAYANNGFSRQLNQNDSVIVYNNLLHLPSHNDILMFANRLWNLDRIIDVNANAQKTPLIIQCDETQRLTLLNLYKKYDGNAPIIFADKSLKLDDFKCVKTDAPYIADKIYSLKKNIWNEALTSLGISNFDMEKKEHLITDEISVEMGDIMSARFSRLAARKQACEKINNMFGLNIDCRYRGKEVVDNEQIYN